MTAWIDSTVDSAPYAHQRVLIWCEGAVAGVWIGVREEDSRFTYRIDEPDRQLGGFYVRAALWQPLPAAPLESQSEQAAAPAASEP